MRKTQRQLLVECSEPGLVVSLAEEFEHVLRRVDFARAQALRDQLRDLARELGPEFERAWASFRMEVPNDGDRPLAFGSREAGAEDEAPLKQLLSQAGQRGIGQFKLRDTLLLPQSGPSPETQEQYIHDLADGMSWCCWEELGLFSMPVELPPSMAAHRERLMAEHVASVLQARARFPHVGYRWVQDSVERVRKALDEVNTRAEAVMEYELERLDPQAVNAREHILWAALAVRLGKQVQKWHAAAEQPIDYLYLRVALVHLLWTECRGGGPARPFLEQRLQSLVEQAGDIYTADGVAAVQRVCDDLRKPLWGTLDKLSEADEEKADEPGGNE